MVNSIKGYSIGSWYVQKFSGVRENTPAIAQQVIATITFSLLAEEPSFLIMRTSYVSARRTSCPRIQERTAAIPMMPIDAKSEASIPWRNASETPPTRFVVPMNTSKATLRGIDAEATVIAMTKLPRIPMFCTVLRSPEIPPKEP
jgi:hypothetical protein